MPDHVEVSCLEVLDAFAYAGDALRRLEDSRKVDTERVRNSCRQMQDAIRSIKTADAVLSTLRGRALIW